MYLKIICKVLTFFLSFFKNILGFFVVFLFFVLHMSYPITSHSL